MSVPLDPERVAAVRANLGELATTMGLTLTTVTADLVQADLPVAGNRQPYGLLHGGANAVVAETLGSVHSALLAPEGAYPVGIELSCTHHRSAREGTVHGTCRPIVTGRTLATMAIEIRDDAGALCCTARLTCLYRTA